MSPVPPTTNLTYDGVDLVAEYNSGGTLLRRYVHGPGVDEPLVWYEGTTTTNKTWLYQDQLGSVIGTANSAGTSTAIHSYGPYGEPNIATGIRFRYTGQQFLGSLNLYYYKARFYSPALGRFLQTDPIGTADDLNLYAYVGNNPINFNDPSGEFANFLLGGAANVAIGYGISWATGQDYSWGNAAVDFGIGAATSGVSAFAAASKLNKIADLSPAAKGVLGESMGAAEIAARGETVVANQVYTRVGGAKPRYDFVAETASGTLKCYECKLGPSASISKSQQIGLDTFSAGGSGSFFGKSATGSGINGLSTSEGEALWYYANGFTPTLRDTLPSALKADFLYQGLTSSGSAYGTTGK